MTKGCSAYSEYAIHQVVASCRQGTRCWAHSFLRGARALICSKKAFPVWEGFSIHAVSGGGGFLAALGMTGFCHCEASAFTGRGNPFLLAHTVRRYMGEGFLAALGMTVGGMRHGFLAALGMTGFCHFEASTLTGRGNPFLLAHTVRRYMGVGFLAATRS